MRSPSGWGDGCHNGRYTWQKSLGVRVFGKLHASALFRTVRQSRGSTAKYCWRELMTPQMQGSRVYEQSPQSDAAGLCWASQRNWFATAKPADWPLSVPGWLKLRVSTTSRDVRNDVSDRSGTWILPRLTGFAVGSTDAISDVDRSRGVGHVVVWRSRSSHRTSTNMRLPEYPDS